MHVHKSRLLTALMILLATFGLIFVMSFLALKRGGVLFDLGLPSEIENLTVIALSLIGIIFSMVEIAHL